MTTLRRHPGLVLVALPAAILVLVLLATWPSGRVSDDDRAAIRAGVVPVAQHRQAPELSGASVSGVGRVRLSQLRGQVVVVNFWASWCTACSREAPRLRTLAREEQGHGVRFVGVDHDDTRSAAAHFLARTHPGYPSVFDPDGRTLRAFGAVGLPSTFIIDRGGRIRYQAIGAFDPGAFQEALDTVLAG
jgi:cytochrome c biogenesis protein CcmG/thiol:disulfide interchange protein DsbE